jgi:hypothetical protein
MHCQLNINSYISWTNKSNIMEKKQVKLINGFTASAWKSLAIKSLRIGWVNGIEECSKNLSKSELRTTLLGSVFEDVFPISYKDLDETYREIMNGDWMALCSRNTLHGRGYAQAFFDDAEYACSEGKKLGDQITREIRSRTSITWINPRVYNCLYSWYAIKPQANGRFYREPLFHEWVGMPKNILDAHTYEGKKINAGMTLLSGSYENHLAIGNRVMQDGLTNPLDQWYSLRNEFINDVIAQPLIENPTLF